jgi:hypothetical protein
MSISETTFKNTQGKVVEPVCGMSVNPERDLKPKPVKKKGWFGRYLERMAKINEKEFGRTGPRCCR